MDEQKKDLIPKEAFHEKYLLEWNLEQLLLDDSFDECSNNESNQNIAY